MRQSTALRERERERVSTATKLEFIKNDITNLVQLKRDSESNISTIVKYFALSLGAFFAFIVFFTSKNSDLDKQIFSIIGICFLIFAIMITYYTSYTLSKNLKRRILYRREIITLRSLANILLGNIYKNTVCQLEDKNFKFTNFKNLPTIAIIMGTSAPLLLFIFLTPFKFDDYVLTIVFFCIIVICLLFLNLYTHHRKEMLFAERMTSTNSEDMLKKRIYYIYSKRKKRTTFKTIKYSLWAAVVFFILLTIFNKGHNTLEQSIPTLLIVFLLIEYTRYKNHAKPFLSFIWNLISKLTHKMKNKTYNTQGDNK